MLAENELSGQLTRSLEVFAERFGDPTPFVYAEFFKRYPEHEQLFFLDPNGDVRGEMLSQALDVLMRADEGDRSAEILVKANRFAHDGYGVAEEQFDRFFSVVRDVVKSNLNADWTDHFEKRWSDILEGLVTARD